MNNWHRINCLLDEEPGSNSSEDGYEVLLSPYDIPTSFYVEESSKDLEIGFRYIDKEKTKVQTLAGDLEVEIGRASNRLYSVICKNLSSYGPEDIFSKINTLKEQLARHGHRAEVMDYLSMSLQHECKTRPALPSA